MITLTRTSMAGLVIMAVCVCGCTNNYHLKGNSRSSAQRLSTSRVGINIESSAADDGNRVLSVQKTLWGKPKATRKNRNPQEIQIGASKPCEKCRVNVILGDHRFTVVTDLAGKVLLRADAFPMKALYEAGSRNATMTFEVQDYAGQANAFWALEWYENEAWKQLQQNFTIDAITNFKARFPFTKHVPELDNRLECLDFVASLRQCAIEDASQSAEAAIRLLGQWREISHSTWPCRVVSSQEWTSKTAKCNTTESLSLNEQRQIAVCETRMKDQEERLLTEWKTEQLKAAKALLDQKSFDEAISKLDGIYALFPDDPDALALNKRVASAKAAYEERIAKEAAREEARLAKEAEREAAREEAEEMERRANGERSYSIEVHYGFIGNIVGMAYPTVTGETELERIEEACDEYCLQGSNPYICKQHCELACMNGSYVYYAKGVDVTIVCKER